MNASILDLRYKMADVLKALDRKERVTVFCRGKKRGVIYPVSDSKAKLKMKDHPMFGMLADEEASVESVMKSLRSPRYGDL